ncbi:unnamed protein product [Cunninghamella blakesleeana]
MEKDTGDWYVKFAHDLYLRNQQDKLFSQHRDYLFHLTTLKLTLESKHSHTLAYLMTICYDDSLNITRSYHSITHLIINNHQILYWYSKQHHFRFSIYSWLRIFLSLTNLGIK